MSEKKVNNGNIPQINQGGAPAIGGQNQTSAYENKVMRAKKILRDSFLREFLYIEDEDGNLIDNPTITDISFNGTAMYVQDNELGRYKVDSARDPRIRAGLPPILPTSKQIKTLGLSIQNTMGAMWNHSEPIMDVELGELRTNFMHETVSPFGITFALRVSRPRLAASKIEDLCDAETAKLLEVFIRCDMNLLISGKTGSGKAFVNSTRIPTPNGWKTIGELKENDFVFDRLGQETKVLGVYPQGKLNTYRLTLADGREFLCNDEHIWTVKELHDTEFKNLTTREIIDSGKIHYIPNNKAVEYPEIETDVDFYELGLKHQTEDISPEYLIGSIAQRKELIRGMLESKSNVYQDGEIVFGTDSLEKMEVFRELANSLGIVTYLNKDLDFSKYVCVLNSEKETLKEIFKDEGILRKLDRLDIHIRNRNSGIIQIKTIEDLGYEEEMTCIRVDNEEHLFLVGNYAVTHNTELQKALIQYIPDHKKITLMEDTLDSHIKQIYKDKDINSWATAGEKGTDNYIGFELLIKAGLRNNPDWLMISEVRAGEALDLLSAALTGHSIMTTLHATGADNIPSRLSNMVSMNENAPDYEALQLDIVSVLNLGLHMEMLTDPVTGRISREIREIYEYIEFRQGVGIIGVPIYQVVQKYDENGGEDGKGIYTKDVIKKGISSRLIDKIKNNRELHNVPAVFLNQNDY